MALYKILSLFLLLFISGGSLSQQSSTVALMPDASSTAKLHDSVVQLVQLMGVRDRMLGAADKMAQDGKEKMLHDFPNYDPAFCDEWAKRMRAQFKVEDYVNVVVRAYEGHFTNEEIVEMIQAQREMNASRTPHISPHLQEKLGEVAVTVQSEIIGGTTQLGSRVGGQIGQELGKEHPEWIKIPKHDTQ